MKPWEYRDRWALITGASAGFGEAYAGALARRGMHLLLTARRAERLDALAASLRAQHGVQTASIPSDLAEPGAPERLWSAATAGGRTIHLLVNNAGVGAQGPFHRLPRERHVALVELNVRAAMEMAHLALQQMHPRGEGGIINVSSAAAFQPLPTNGTYAASKAFLLLLSEALWEENRRAGVRVLALCPGRSPTEFQQIAGTSTVHPRTPGMKTPEQIVESSLRALEKGQSYVIPGALNYLNSFFPGLVPRQLLVRALGRLIHRLV
jgi:uncharacterized protein